MTDRAHRFAARILAAVTLATGGSAAALTAQEALAPSESGGLDAGLWEVATRIEHLDIPGLPAAMVQKMAADPANAKPRAACNIAAAGAPPPPAMFHTLNGQCRYETWQAEAGKLNATLVCSPPDGGPGEARVTLAGRFTRASFEIISETIARDAAGETQLHMRSSLSGKHTAAPGAACAGAQ